MVDVEQLEARVAATFATTGLGMTIWPDPHPDPTKIPSDAYERLANPQKWRILAARTNAWLGALADTGLATIESDALITWKEPPLTLITRLERATRSTLGAVELIVGHSQIGDVDDAGITLGMGNPAEVLAYIPSCGCDACDGGAQPELDRVDDCIRGVMTGAIGRSTDGQLIVVGPPGVPIPGWQGIIAKPWRSPS